ncbi:hypothetical protein GCM10009779_03190 [Polymorphospora rubra]|uniref:Uncharacterized protein n=1 Tax=Polymorphospora rubra TaxID=338584 RepID=A0A810N1R9_9ACTN|nr:hypothetical protein Prubr_26590 [Polymorphospora rubra]
MIVPFLARSRMASSPTYFKAAATWSASKLAVGRSPVAWMLLLDEAFSGRDAVVLACEARLLQLGAGQRLIGHDRYSSPRH